MNQDINNKLAGFRDQRFSRVKLAITDIDGVLRGKYLAVEKFESVLNSGGGFCDCVLGWDVNDTLYDNTRFTGWHTAYPDALYKIDMNTERHLPDENIPFFLADFVSADNPQDLHPICPRSVLKRVLKKAKTLGFEFKLAFEYEFFIFDETPQSVREKNYANLKPLTPGMFGYSIIRNSVQSDLFNDFMDYCDSMNFPIEGLHCETGPAVWEAALKYTDALEACDRASLFKTFAKVFFQKKNLMATFMARWSLNYPGQSGHIHQSMLDLKSGKPIFHNKSDEYGMSRLMKNYVAGQVKYSQPFLALTSPTINSYTRLVKGFWAPTAATWGVENRTTALRVIPGTENSQRVEFRVGSADANPYLAAAAVIGAGLLGIQERLELDDPVRGSAYEVQDKLPAHLQFPTNLRSSVENLKASPIARDIFGKEFIEHYISTREWEVREYERAVTDWQVRRYFEII